MVVPEECLRGIVREHALPSHEDLANKHTLCFPTHEGGPFITDQRVAYLIYKRFVRLAGS